MVWSSCPVRLENQAQSDRAESIAKAIDGVKSVKKRSENEVKQYHSPVRLKTAGEIKTISGKAGE